MTTEQQQADAGGVEQHLAKHGKVSYLELPADDAKRAAQFYKQCFGWTITGGEEFPGFSDVTAGLIGHWIPGRAVSREAGILPYIYVDRIDDAVERIRSNGGQVERAPYQEGALWVATFRDPAGNLLGIWQAGPR